MQSLWWFRSKEGGSFFFLLFGVPFLYLLCFWFCSCWIDLHMCCRQSSGLHACTHMWCLYQQDPPWDLPAFLQLKLLSFKNRAYWHVSPQTNKRKKNSPTSNSGFPERGMLKSDVNVWGRGLFLWLLFTSRFSTGGILVLCGVVFQLWKTHTPCRDTPSRRACCIFWW